MYILIGPYFFYYYLICLLNTRFKLYLFFKFSCCSRSVLLCLTWLNKYLLSYLIYLISSNQLMLLLIPLIAGCRIKRMQLFL